MHSNRTAYQPVPALDVDVGEDRIVPVLNQPGDSYKASRHIAGQQLIQPDLTDRSIARAESLVSCHQALQPQPAGYQPVPAIDALMLDDDRQGAAFSPMQNSHADGRQSSFSMPVDMNMDVLGMADTVVERRLLQRFIETHVLDGPGQLLQTWPSLQFYLDTAVVRIFHFGRRQDCFQQQADAWTPDVCLLLKYRCLHSSADA